MVEATSNLRLRSSVFGRHLVRSPFPSRLVLSSPDALVLQIGQIHHRIEGYRLHPGPPGLLVGLSQSTRFSFTILVGVRFIE